MKSWETFCFGISLWAWFKCWKGRNWCHRPIRLICAIVLAAMKYPFYPATCFHPSSKIHAHPRMFYLWMSELWRAYFCPNQSKYYHHLFLYRLMMNRFWIFSLVFAVLNMKRNIYEIGSQPQKQNGNPNQSGLQEKIKQKQNTHVFWTRITVRRWWSLLLLWHFLLLLLLYQRFWSSKTIFFTSEWKKKS